MENAFDDIIFPFDELFCLFLFKKKKNFEGKRTFEWTHTKKKFRRK